MLVKSNCSNLQSHISNPFFRVVNSIHGSKFFIFLQEEKLIERRYKFPWLSVLYVTAVLEFALK